MRGSGSQRWNMAVSQNQLPAADGWMLLLLCLSLQLVAPALAASSKADSRLLEGAALGSAHTVRTALEAGADIAVQNNNGHTPLMLAKLKMEQLSGQDDKEKRQRV